MRQKIILKGLGVSPGIIQGKVRIINQSEKYPTFKEGDILITKITDPTMVIMMAKAGAIICDIGGMTSHPSIVSREMGIPCIVNTKKATQVLKNGKNGMNIKVNGHQGKVYLVD